MFQNILSSHQDQLASLGHVYDKLPLQAAVKQELNPGTAAKRAQISEVRSGRLSAYI